MDTAVIPAAAKAALREGIAKLQKRVLDGLKAAGAANKRKAIDTAVAAAAAAVAGGRGYLVTELDVGLDSKAVQEAYRAVQEAQPSLPTLFVTADATGAPSNMSSAGAGNVKHPLRSSMWMEMDSLWILAAAATKFCGRCRQEEGPGVRRRARCSDKQAAGRGVGESSACPARRQVRPKSQIISGARAGFCQGSTSFGSSRGICCGAVERLVIQCPSLQLQVRPRVRKFIDPHSRDNSQNSQLF